MFGWLRRRHRRDVAQRLQYLVPELATVPRRCPICNGTMLGFVHRMEFITNYGPEVLLVCGICKALGPLESLLAAENSQAGPRPPGA